MDILTRYNDYAILSPDFFIEFISLEMANRDLAGLTADRIKAINVTGEHPLVQLTGSIMNTGNADFAGLLPAVSVSDDSETEENTTMGQGMRTYQYLTIETLDYIKEHFGKMQDRVYEGLITDKQISMMENELIKAGVEEKIFVEVHEYYIHESVFVSLWTNHIQERQILGVLLRSILLDCKKAMMGRGLFDFTMHTSKGLVNPNFGRLLYGQETEITYRQPIKNYTVYKAGIVPENVNVKAKYTEQSPGTQFTIIHE